MGEQTKAQLRVALDAIMHKAYELGREFEPLPPE